MRRGDLPNSGIGTDTFQIMPNHIHGIIIVGATPRGCLGNGRAQGPAPTVSLPSSLSLPDVVHRFKTMTTKRYVDGVKQNGWLPFPGRLWQRNYHDRIIRDEDELNRILEYILENPAAWETDQENPERRADSNSAQSDMGEAWQV